MLDCYNIYAVDFIIGFERIIRKEITWTEFEELAINIEQEFKTMYSMNNNDDGYDEFVDSMLVKEGDCVRVYNCSTKESWHWDGIPNE